MKNGPWGQPRLPGQENRGRAWSEDDENRLVQMLYGGASINTCAAEFKRTLGGIRSRQLDIAYRYVEEGKTVTEACQIMKIDEDLLIKSIRLRSAAKEAKRNKKKDISTQTTTIVRKVEPHTELSLLVEIRDLLKLLVAANPSAPFPSAPVSGTVAQRSTRVE